MIVGTKTGIILSAIVTPPNVNDTTQYEQLLLNASKITDIKEVSADRAYLSRKNVDITSSLGGIPFIPVKRICTGRKRGSANWHKAYNFFYEHNDLFMQHYHLRSNVESVFSTMKRVTPRKLMTGSFTSQKNEVLLKCLTHNLRVLSREQFIIKSIIDHFEKGTITA